MNTWMFNIKKRWFLKWCRPKVSEKLAIAANVASFRPIDVSLRPQVYLAKCHFINNKVE